MGVFEQEAIYLFIYLVIKDKLLLGEPGWFSWRNIGLLIPGS